MLVDCLCVKLRGAAPWPRLGLWAVANLSCVRRAVSLPSRRGGCGTTPRREGVTCNQPSDFHLDSRFSYYSSTSSGSGAARVSRSTRMTPPSPCCGVRQCALCSIASCTGHWCYRRPCVCGMLTSSRRTVRQLRGSPLVASHRCAAASTQVYRHRVNPSDIHKRVTIYLNAIRNAAGPFAVPS